ncbi:MAG: methionine synthase [Deltaproteobacteria bacterium]|nr:methionine synthase [Deltaproteobacteria bacterium]
MKDNTEPDFHFTATGIGSIPFQDPENSCLKILEQVRDIPFWPQLVQRSHFEDMNIQYSEGLPLLQVNEKERILVTSPESEVEKELTRFFEHFLEGDTAYFSISREYAPGLYNMTELIAQNPDRYGKYVKGHSVGPVTFASSIKGPDGKSIISNPDLLDALTKGLAIKGLWQIKKLASTGKKTIIFFDEPCLSGFGSAFSPIERHEVIALLKEVIDYLRERSDTLVGIHCCGNTDWSMIAETGADIINFDAFAFMDYFLLYPDEIRNFIQQGGTIAWGIVPTSELTPVETADSLYLKLEKGLNTLYDWGLDRKLIIKSSILTPACGMGTLDPALSERVLELLIQLSDKMQAY